jgi:hypothetical protein
MLFTKFATVVMDGPVRVLGLERGGKQPASLVGVDVLLLETKSAGPQVDDKSLLFGD